MWQKLKQAKYHTKLMIAATVGMAIGIGGLTGNFFALILVAGILCLIGAMITFLQGV